MSKTNLPLASYRVVKIIDAETIVINAGSNNGISRGDEFEIFETGENITDPITGTDLGTLDTIKEIVTAVNVFPKMSICRQYVTYNTIASPLQNFTKKTPKTLNIDASQISGGLSKDKVIRIGDKARRTDCD